MSEWRRTPLAMHQRRGAGGGVRACGAQARERERRATERRGARAAERAQGRETASPMVLHSVVGEEVAATFRSQLSSWLLCLYAKRAALLPLPSLTHSFISSLVSVRASCELFRLRRGGTLIYFGFADVQTRTLRAGGRCLAVRTDEVKTVL